MVTMATQNTNGSSQERPADIAEQMMGVGHRTTEPLGCGTLRLEGGVAWRADDASFPIFLLKKTHNNNTHGHGLSNGSAHQWLVASEPFCELLYTCAERGREAQFGPRSCNVNKRNSAAT